MPLDGQRGLGPMRAPLPRPWRIVRGIAVPILVLWSLVAAVVAGTVSEMIVWYRHKW